MKHVTDEQMEQILSDCPSRFRTADENVAMEFVDEDVDPMQMCSVFYNWLSDSYAPYYFVEMLTSLQTVRPS